MFRLQLQIKPARMALPGVAALALLAACGSVQKIGALNGTTGGWYSVTAEQTPFYKYGPQQGNGPDEQLPKEALLKVIRPSFGYVKVKLQDGQDGYVASEDIRPAPATLVAEKLAPPPEPAPLLANHEDQFRIDSEDPRLIAPPEPLPEASATPRFR